MCKLARKVVTIQFLIFLLGGCATSGQRYQNPTMDFGSVRRVAVLPFTNLSRDTGAAERVRDVFSTMLLASGSMYVVPPGEVLRGLTRTTPADPARPSPEEVKRLGGIIGVDAVITGLVREYGDVRSGQTAANVVSVSLQMIETQTGTVVWAAETTKGGITLRDRLFGARGEPMNVVTQQAVNDLMDKLFEK
jgi:hypothetical protein